MSKLYRINPRIDQNLDAKLKQASQILGISRADLARQAIEAYLEKCLKVKTPAV
jgi:predicted DNA-binding protein